MNTPDPSTPCYTINDVATILGKQSGWVVKAARAGKIPHEKVGRDYRFTPQDIADYLESVRVAATNPLARNARQVAATKRRRSL